MAIYYVTNRVRDVAGQLTVLPDMSGHLNVWRADAETLDSATINATTPVFTVDSSLSDKQFRAAIKQLSGDAFNEAAKGSHLPHIVIFIHGFNNNVDASLGTMASIKTGLNNQGFLPQMVCFDWPSDGQVQRYLSDQGDASRTVPAIAVMMDFIKRWQQDQKDKCLVNISVIAHSMGNLVLREGLNVFHRTLGFPTALPMLTEVLMVAADVDSDTLVVGGKGTGITSLSRRVTAYSSRHDNTLAISNFAKHPGSARLGRNGPNDFASLPRNVVSVDCTDVVRPIAPSDIFSEADPNEMFTQLFGVHSAYWENATWESDAAATLKGIDRDVIKTRVEVEKVMPPKVAYQLVKPKN